MTEDRKISEKRQPESPAARERPWLRLAEWEDGQEFYDQARSCLRMVREQGLEREAEADLWVLLDPDAPWDLLNVQPGDEKRRRAAMLLWALLGGQEGRDPDGEPRLRDTIGVGCNEVGQAWFELGYFLFFVGEGLTAEIPLRRAIDAGHPDYVDQGLYYLAMVLGDQEGREHEAELLFCQAAQCDSLFGELAQNYLGASLWEKGREREAEEFLRQAMDAKWGLVAATARCNLGVLLSTQEGRERDAEALLREAIDTSIPEFAATVPKALCRLGILLGSQEGREREAEGFLRRAIESADPRFASIAATHLQRLAGGRNEPG